MKGCETLINAIIISQIMVQNLYNLFTHYKDQVITKAIQENNQKFTLENLNAYAATVIVLLTYLTTWQFLYLVLCFQISEQRVKQEVSYCHQCKEYLRSLRVMN